jgi:hypothetical protein
MKKLTPFQENIGYGSFLTGSLTLILGITWFVNTFFEVGSPALIERQTTVIVMFAGAIMILVGLSITWPRGKG